MTGDTSGHGRLPPGPGGLPWGGTATPLDGRALWGRDARWQIRLRWFVPPALIAGTAGARAFGVAVAPVPIAALALVVLLYNIAFWLLLARGVGRSHRAARWAADRAAPLQVALDYGVTFGLVHLTGGVASPLLLFFLFHVVFAAVLLPAGAAWLFALVGAGGMALMTALEVGGYLAPAGPEAWSRAAAGSLPGTLAAALLLSFTVTALVLAASVTAIMARLRAENARALRAGADLAEERARLTLQVVHNLRAPVAAAVSLIELVSGGMLGKLGADQAATLGRAAARLRGLGDALGELLTLAQRGRVRRTPGAELVDMTATTREVTATFRPLAEERGVTVSLDAPDQRLVVKGDSKALAGLVENLVSNAVKYTARGGTVHVHVTPDGAGRVRLTVRDTGIGIPESEQGRVFQEFFRASNAKQSDAAGTGLGLAIVRQTAEQHGGTVGFTSAAGRGTAFTVALPTADDEVRPAGT
jgi:signal transduction histidine kinase